MNQTWRGSHQNLRFLAKLDRSCGNLGTDYLWLASEVGWQQSCGWEWAFSLWDLTLSPGSKSSEIVGHPAVVENNTSHMWGNPTPPPRIWWPEVLEVKCLVWVIKETHRKERQEGKTGWFFLHKGIKGHIFVPLPSSLAMLKDNAWLSL